jgi:hypothetical protein
MKRIPKFWHIGHDQAKERDLKIDCFWSIDNGQAIVVGIRCFESFVCAPNGIIPLPKPEEKEIGNHAICIVGYNSLEECFIFTNSWGKDWGDNGLGKLPFAYFDSGLVLEINGVGKDPRSIDSFLKKWRRRFSGIIKFFSSIFKRKEEILYGGAVGQLNSFNFTVHSNDHGKHFHVVDMERGINARFSYPEIKLLNYKNSRDMLRSKEEKNIIEFFKKPDNFEKLRKEFEKRG